MPHEFFTFPFWNHAFCAFLGAGLLYMRWGRSKLKAFGIGHFLNKFEMSKMMRMRLEMLIFVLVGTIVATELTKPSTEMQAFSAGLGWTGIVAKPYLNGLKRP